MIYQSVRHDKHAVWKELMSYSWGAHRTHG